MHRAPPSAPAKRPSASQGANAPVRPAACGVRARVPASNCRSYGLAARGREEPVAVRLAGRPGPASPARPSASGPRRHTRPQPAPGAPRSRRRSSGVRAPSTKSAACSRQILVLVCCHHMVPASDVAQLPERQPDSRLHRAERLLQALGDFHVREAFVNTPAQSPRAEEPAGHRAPPARIQFARPRALAGPADIRGSTTWATVAHRRRHVLRPGAARSAADRWRGSASSVNNHAATAPLDASYCAACRQAWENTSCTMSSASPWS